MRRHKLACITIGIASLATIGGIAALYIWQASLKPVASKTPAASTPAPAPAAPKYYSPLTGRELADEATAKRQVTAIMIENSPDARPQSGLGAAGVVFEAIAEGGITRFLTLFQEDRPNLVGPVRSLRPYYVDWLAAFDPAVAHVGGSAKALNEIRSGRYKDIDQFFNGAYFWRATDRYAPHNVYTSFDKLDALNQKKGFTSSTFTSFPRKIGKPAKAPHATKIDIDISYALFNVHYDWDQSKNDYIRYVAGKPHLDRESGQIRADTVIVIKVPTSLGKEDGLREQMASLGSGGAYIFQDGTLTEGTWKKPDKRDQITFADKEGKAITLNRGRTWISVIAPNKSVVWK